MIDMLFVIDYEGIIATVNSAACEVLGYNQDELIGKPFSMIFADIKDSPTEVQLLDICNSEEHKNIETNIKSKSQAQSAHLFTVICSFSAMKDIDGDSFEIVCIIKDITERKSYEENLRKLSSAVEQSLSAMVITNINGEIEFVNKKFTENTGYTFEEAKGQTPRILKSGKHPPEFYKNMWETILSGNEFRSDICNKRKDGSLSWELISIAPIKDTAGRITHFIAVKIDDLERKQAEERLRYMAHYDALTGIPNRALFEDRLNQTIHAAKRNKNKFAILFLDLDRFKLVNDTLGHDVGDILLKEVAQRLLLCVRQVDTVSRMGGDEFQIILSEIEQFYNPTIVAQKIIESLGKIFIIKGNECSIGASIGICVYPENGDTAEILLKNADLAMYQVKERGRNDFQYYEASMDAANIERLNLEISLRKAVENNEFILYYQPQVDLLSGEIVGAESLIRWLHPQMGMISPARFIPIAEETGLINDIGNWVVHTACMQGKALHDMGYDKLRISVNISSVQFRNPSLAEKLKDIINKTGFNPNYLDLELTESGIMKDVQQNIKMMNELKAIGARISIDDFGTGYSSLAYLKSFPIDILKVDQSFIKNSTTDPNDAIITSTIINMAHSFKFKVIAEGVELIEQLELLRTFNCDEIQGYIFSKPLPEAEFLKLLEEEKHFQV
jgi:diguanylate cyclase (GGDEF)-like protein/PAS domain S-box-containing protein